MTQGAFGAGTWRRVVTSNGAELLFCAYLAAVSLGAYARASGLF